MSDQFWRPLKKALSNLQRRMDIFFAGENNIEGYQGIWVASMGHFLGLFDSPWLEIPPTRKIAMLRYGSSITL